MMMISDLSRDMVEEILFRVPITALRSVRTTCKQWNALSKDPSFAKKHRGKAGKEILSIMVYDSRVCLMSINLHNHKDLVEPSINRLGQLNADKIWKVYHCDCILLCLTTKDPRLVVWNPYLGQTRWIQPSNTSYSTADRYILGYDNNKKKKNRKILSYSYYFKNSNEGLIVEYQIYDFSSNSWKILDITSTWTIPYFCRHCVSLKGNSYFVAHEKGKVEIEEFLLCFDFTRERFVQRLDMPFHSCIKDSVILSSVREEHLAVLFQRHNRYEMEIWVTTKIDPDEVSWSNLFKVDTKLFIGRINGSFVLDEKKKIAVIFDQDREKRTNYKAYIIGEDGYHREEDLGESECLSLVCSYYVPSSVQIQQPMHAASCKRKQRDY